MRIQTASLLAIATIARTASVWTDSAVHETVLPTVQPTATRDAWQCAVANLTQYFDVPKPTGALFDALNTYGDKLIESCTATGTDRINGGCFPGKDDWCKFTTAAPASVLPNYQLYGSAASSWWAVSSASAVSLARECPSGWYNAMFELPGGPTWLNETIVFAACHAEAVTTTAGSSRSTSSSMSTKSAATTLPGVTAMPTASATPAPTNGIGGRGGDLEMWIVAGIGFVAAAANSILNKV